MIRTHSFVALACLLAGILAGCETPGDPTGEPQPIAWPKAIELVNAGMVEQAFQTHARAVYLVLKDGSTASTVEPQIDDIIYAIRNCGQKCESIMVATE